MDIAADRRLEVGVPAVRKPLYVSGAHDVERSSPVKSKRTETGMSRRMLALGHSRTGLRPLVVPKRAWCFVTLTALGTETEDGKDREYVLPRGTRDLSGRAVGCKLFMECVRPSCVESCVLGRRRGALDQFLCP